MILKKTVFWYAATLYRAIRVYYYSRERAAYRESRGESRVLYSTLRDIGGIESLDSSGGSAAASFFAIFGKFGIIAPRRENRGRSFLRHLDDFPLRIKWER